VTALGKSPNVVPSELVLTSREFAPAVRGSPQAAERPVPRADYRAAWERGEKYEPDTAVEPRSAPEPPPG
jgi:hypothetical protein